jgi:hypothetical protein
MDGQRARLTRTLDRVPAIRRASMDDVPRPAARRPPGRITRTWAGVLAVGWPLAIVIAATVEPAPANPEAAVPVVVVLAELGLFAGLIATAVMASQRHTSAVLAGLATGLLAMTMTITCPLSGHHTIGAWWYAQLTVVGAMLAANLAALGRRARAGH